MTLEEIDHRFAKTLLQGRKDEELHLFLARLLAETRKGAPMLLYPGIGEKAAFLLEEGGPLVAYGDAYYLRRVWESETKVLSELRRILAEEVAPLSFALPSDLYPAQQEVLALAASKKLVLLTGGPGSGKTTVARALFAAFLACKPDAEVVAAAPTGKALSRLEYPGVTTKTLHRLLGLSETRRTSRKRIDADLLLVDECSMIDLSLFEELFSALAPHVRLLLVGDPNQLPPIGTRGIFADLSSLPLPHVHLNQTKRTDKAGLLALAELVLAGKGKEALEKIEGGLFPEISFSPLPKSPPLVTKEGEVLLTPFSTGIHGTQHCNRLSKAAWRGEKLPILITKNDYTTGLMNGDIGYIQGSTAYFPNHPSLPLPLLPPYDYAFALTIHKSQGSEFPHVLLLLPEELSLDEGQELFYTAITRAKETLHIYSSQETFLQITSQRAKKESLFVTRFMQELAPHGQS